MSSVEADNQLFRIKITYLSFVLSILVILIHTVNLNVYNIQTGTLFYVERIINSVADYAVPTFFMISGYQFYRELSVATIKRKLISRFYSIVIPLLLWGGIEYLFFATLKSLPIIGSQMNVAGNPFDIRNLIDIVILGGVAPMVLTKSYPIPSDRLCIYSDTE